MSGFESVYIPYIYEWVGSHNGVHFKQWISRSSQSDGGCLSQAATIIVKGCVDCSRSEQRADHLLQAEGVTPKSAQLCCSRAKAEVQNFWDGALQVVKPVHSPSL